MQLALDWEPPPLRIVVLGSGSGGNALIVESEGYRVLVDAGFSPRELERRMAQVGVEPGSLGAVLLTHEHRDHIQGADRFTRRFRLPIYATQGTLEASGLAADGDRPTLPLRSGEPCEVGSLQVEPFALPHDAREPVGLVIQDGRGRRIGLVADLGSRSRLAWGRLMDLDLLVLECNHDLEMLRAGPYPWALKQRVASRHGHLSNREAAEGAVELLCDRLRWVVLYHLSRTNNLPALAAATVGEALAVAGSRAEIVVTDQKRPTGWIEIE